MYFQPPQNFRMKYPCIVYERSTSREAYADNTTYRHIWGYDVTYIDREPDSDVVDRLAELPMCRFERHYVSDNLHHVRFAIFY